MFEKPPRDVLLQRVQSLEDQVSTLNVVLFAIPGVTSAHTPGFKGDITDILAMLVKAGKADGIMVNKFLTETGRDL